MIISCSFLLSMRNISIEICREYQNTQFRLENLFFLENTSVYENVQKSCRAGQTTNDNMAQAH